MQMLNIYIYILNILELFVRSWTTDFPIQVIKIWQPCLKTCAIVRACSKKMGHCSWSGTLLMIYNRAAAQNKKDCQTPGLRILLNQ